MEEDVAGRRRVAVKPVLLLGALAVVLVALAGALASLARGRRPALIARPA
jgi:hypothetical protein